MNLSAYKNSVEKVDIYDICAGDFVKIFVINPSTEVLTPRICKVIMLHENQSENTTDLVLLDLLNSVSIRRTYNNNDSLFRVDIPEQYNV